MLRTLVLFLAGGALWSADVLDPRDEPVPRPLNDRIAVLVGAGEFPDPGWRLANSAADLNAISDALANGADLAPAFQVRVQGGAVTVSGVKKAIKDAASRLSAPAGGGEALLVVYWSGHAFTDAEGKQVYFTANTAPGEMVDNLPSFTDTIGRDALLAWIGNARTECAAAGVRFRCVIINDVCRIEVKAAPRAAVFRPETAWEWFGTAAGEYSLASQRADTPSVFTANLLRVLPQQAKLGAAQPLTDTALTVAAAIQGQKPELRTPAEAGDVPALVRPAKIRPVIHLIDAFSLAILPRGTLSVDGGPELAVVVDQQLALNPGSGRLLRAQAGGYLANECDVNATRELSGHALVIPLHPEVVVIRGLVAGAQTNARVTGFLADIRDDVHRTVAQTRPDGSFELVLPRIEAGLTVKVMGREFTIPGDPQLWPLAGFRDRLKVPTFVIDAGRPIIPAEAFAAAAAAAAAQQVPSLPSKPSAPVVPVSTPAITAVVDPAAASTQSTADASTGTGTGTGIVIAPLKGASLVAGVKTAEIRTPGLWPMASIVTGAPVPAQADGSFDLTALGSAVGTRPARFDPVRRLARVTDVSDLGSAPGQILRTPVVPVPRVKTIVDLTAAGSPVGYEPQPITVAIPRRKQVVDLTSNGTFAGYAPPPPIDPVDRAEAITDLANDGTAPEAYSISEALAKSLADAVTVAP